MKVTFDLGGIRQSGELVRTNLVNGVPVSVIVKPDQPPPGYINKEYGAEIKRKIDRDNVIFER